METTSKFYFFQSVFQNLNNASASIVYLYLWSLTIDRGYQSTLQSYEQIARGTGLSKSTVQNAVKLLVKQGFIAGQKTKPTSTPVYFVYQAQLSPQVPEVQVPVSQAVPQPVPQPSSFQPPPVSQPALQSSTPTPSAPSAPAYTGPSHAALAEAVATPSVSETGPDSDGHTAPRAHSEPYRNSGPVPTLQSRSLRRKRHQMRKKVNRWRKRVRRVA